MWIDLANRANHTVTGAILVQKALEFAQKLGISDFNASAVSGNLCNLCYQLSVINYHLSNRDGKRTLNEEIILNKDYCKSGDTMQMKPDFIGS